MTTPIALRYVGAAQTYAEDLTHRAYMLGLLGANISQAEVDALIATGFAPYVRKDYVDAQDALNATKAFIDAGDATKLKLAQKETNNGIAALGPSGRVNVSHVNVASTQRFPHPFLSPTAYHAAPVTATGTEVLLYPPVTVADPGYPYKLMVTGLVDANTSLDGEFPIIRVRQGSATGQLVATGAGGAQAYTGGVLTEFTAEGGQPYTIAPWTATMDVIGVGGGGGGAGGNGFGGDGKGGRKGVVVTTTITRGVHIPLGTNTMTVTPGGPGALGDNDNQPGGAGGATVVAGDGWGGLTAAGGAGGTGTNPPFGTEYYGQGPGPITFNGHTYPGGANQTVLSQPGNPPGGGGSGGDGQFLDADKGGPGAPGAAWILAYPNPNVPYGPVTIVPSAYNAQAVITGATTLHVMLARSGAAATVTASPLRPALYVVPVPA